jgi:hypothetical protein
MAVFKHFPAHPRVIQRVCKISIEDATFIYNSCEMIPEPMAALLAVNEMVGLILFQGGLILSKRRFLETYGPEGIIWRRLPEDL